MNKVHHPSKKMSILKRPIALPPKMTPSAMMAMPQTIGLICFILLLLFSKVIIAYLRFWEKGVDFFILQEYNNK